MILGNKMFRIRRLQVSDVDNRLEKYRIEERHSLLFGLFHYWDNGSFSLSPDYITYSHSRAMDVILEKYPKAIILDII